MGTIAAVITLLSALASIWLIYAKRKKTPTPEEQRADVDLETQEAMEQVTRFRQEGKNAEADAILRSLHDRATDGLCDHKQPPNS